MIAYMDTEKEKLKRLERKALIQSKYWMQQLDLASLAKTQT